MANHALSASVPDQLFLLDVEQNDIQSQITCALDGMSAIVPLLEDGWPDDGQGLSVRESGQLLAGLSAHIYLLRHQLDRLDRVFESGNQLINFKKNER